MKPSTKFSRYTMFALLYFAQGSIMGYFAALNSIYFLESGLEMTQAGLIGTIAMIPFVLKIFLGILSDRVNLFGFGHRKPYIIIGLMLQAFCLILIIFISPENNFGIYAFIAFILMSGMALYDTCTDGYALDSTPEEEEGFVQGVMVGGRAVGTIFVGLLGVIAHSFGWNAVFVSLAILTLLPLPFVLIFMSETERKVADKFEWKAFRAFNNRSIIGLALLGALYSFCIYGAYEIVAPALSTQFNMSVGPTSLIISTWGVGVVIGGLMGGPISKKFGFRKSVTMAVVFALISTGLLAVVLNPVIVWIVVPIFGIAFGLYETLFFAVAMNQTDSRIAASMFAILMAIANIGTGIGLGLTGVFVDSFGYPTTFIILSLANLLAFPLLSMMFSKKPASNLVVESD
ncbi:MAG: MFS transporter [Anaerolineaceae bacterium]|nr:MFS transporter [Anaerolineaceae bacterium]